MDFLTTSEVADVLSRDHAPPGKTIAVWQVRRVFKLGLLPEPAKAGLYRVIPAAQVAEIARVMRDRGWFSEQASSEAHS